MTTAKNKVARAMNGEAVQLNSPAEMRAFLREMQRRQWAEAMEATKQLRTPIAADDMDAFLARYGDNATRFALFIHITAHFETTPEAYARGLRSAYTSAATPFDSDSMLRMFAAVPDMRLFMDADEMKTYDAMPDVVRIYRGCNRREHKKHVYGSSWTTQQRVAEFFAWRFDAQDSSRIVVATDIPKADILAYFNGRNEYEVIAKVRGSAQDYTTIEQPTQLYWDYMKTPRY